MHLLHPNFSPFPVDDTAAAYRSCVDYQYLSQDTEFFYDNTAVLDSQGELSLLFSVQYRFSPFLASDYDLRLIIEPENTN